MKGTEMSAADQFNQPRKEFHDADDDELFQCICGSRDVRLKPVDRQILMCCEACYEILSFGVFEFIQLLLDEAGIAGFTLGAQIKVTDFNSAVLGVEEVGDAEEGKGD